MASEEYLKARANIPGHLNVLSIFATVDGECNAFGQGSMSVFIRLSGCRVGCSYCFGQKEGKRHPEVHLAGGGRKKLSEVLVGDVLLTLDESHALVQTMVTETHNRRVTEWIEVKIKNHSKLDSTTFFVTPEHPFFTTRGQVCAEDLKVGDDIYHVNPNELVSYYKLGSRNPNYKETIPHNVNYGKLKTENLTEERNCQICGNLSLLEVHHKDGDRNNDEAENLSSLCRPCHSKLHQRGANFWNGNRADGKRSYAELNHNGAKVLKITKVSRDPKVNWRAQGMAPDLPVYNISCAPHNTYLLNTMWVHNCDTKYSWSIKQGQQFRPEEIVHRVAQIGGGIKKVTITGGEPLEQDGEEFITLLRQLLAYGYQISIETSGMYPFIQYASTPNLALVVDLKSPTTVPGHQEPLLSEMVKLGSKQHCIKVVISSPAEFEWAVRESANLVDAGCFARIYFSPDHTNMKAVDLFELMMGDELCRNLNIGLNLQLHKYLFPENFREEELISASILKEIHDDNA